MVWLPFLNRVVRVDVIVKVAFNKDFMEVKEVPMNTEGKVFQMEMHRPWGGSVSDKSEERETYVDRAD